MNILEAIKYLKGNSYEAANLRYVHRKSEPNCYYFFNGVNVSICVFDPKRDWTTLARFDSNQIEFDDYEKITERGLKIKRDKWLRELKERDKYLEDKEMQIVSTEEGYFLEVYKK